MGNSESDWLQDNHTAVVFHTSKNTDSEGLVRDTFRVCSPLCMEWKLELPHKSPASWKENTYLISIMGEGICLEMENKTLEIMEITLGL